jgi:transposase-like protein
VDVTIRRIVMTSKAFQLLTNLFTQLTKTQRVQSIEILNQPIDTANPKEVPAKVAKAINLLSELAEPIPPCVAEAILEKCPHCGHSQLWRWGESDHMPRWRCQGCQKTFNVLTKTPLARLRHKDKWPANAEAMIAGLTVRKTAEKCEVHRNTAFRWRHRFLMLPQKAQRKDLNGIAESDVTYFRQSEKGARKLDRKPRKRSGQGIKSGLSKEEQVRLLTLRDRSGNGAERVITETLTQPAKDLFNGHLREDTILVTDGNPELCAAARARNRFAHKRLVGKEGRGQKGSPFHLQTNNGYHGKLKIWMMRFHGIATKYLANYAGWFRHLFEGTHQDNANSFIKLSFNPLEVCQQLTVT